MKWFFVPFYRVSLWMVEKLPKSAWENQRKEERLRALYPQEQRSLKEYAAKRLAVVLAVLFWGFAAAAFAQLMLMEQEERIERMDRPSYGEGSRQTELLAYVEGETNELSVPVMIGEQEYTAEEVQALLRDMMEALDEEILGENESLDEVRGRLYLPDSLWDGGVDVTWSVSPEDLMDVQGNLLREPKAAGELAELRAVLKYGEYEAEYVCHVGVYPPIRSAQEQLEKELQEAVALADAQGRYEREIHLPKELDGKKVWWERADASAGGVLAICTVIVVIGLWARWRQELEKREKERKRQLALDYPELLFRMATLLGAGLTLKNAFFRIAAGYEKRKEGEMRYGYEEMLVSCREMEHGVGEAKVYERFGKRCGESAYVKLGFLLSQNLKKGTKGLQELLEREAEAGFEERKNIARKLGEEAGTKLLLPMALMLGIVLVILTVPALISL